MMNHPHLSVFIRVHPWLLTLLLVGCAAPPTNPSFPLTAADAKIAWSAMKEHPKPLDRPVIVLGGIYDPGIAANHVASQIQEIAGKNAPLLHIGFLEIGSFDGSARKVIEAVDQHFPNYEHDQTIEVDVIGFSLGGLVGRYAASKMFAAEYGRRLNIKRLFTVSSPHRGAKLAWVPTFDSRIIDMRADSEFMKQLNDEPRAYELFTYARLGDKVVGEANAAPPGQTAWWVAKSFSLSHISAYCDSRILADIARRLRSETPFTTSPPAPLPGPSLLANGP